MNFDGMIRVDEGAPRVVRIEDVPALSYLDIEARREFWGHVGLLPTLERLSRIFADLDLARMTNSDDDVVLAFLSEVSEPAGAQTADLLARGNAVLHPMPLFLAIKEVIEWADVDGDTAPTSDELLAVFLSLSAEAHDAAMPTEGAGLDQMLDEMTLTRLTQTALLHPEPLELLSASTEGIWYRGWSDRTSDKVKRNLADSPAAQWAEITGVDLDDLLSLGWLFYNLWKHEALTCIEPEFFGRYAVAPEAVDFLMSHCTVSIADLRNQLAQERAQNASLWTRYKLQQTPFVRLDDGTLLPIRFQYVIQRIFGDHLYLETEHMLRVADSKKADHYAEAMRNIFEERVGEVLQRICAYDESGETVLVEESEMKRVWRTNKSTPPKICDFALSRGHGCILIDANMRSLPQPFAEGAATIESLQLEIEQRFTTTKFRQLLSTVDLFMSRGWNRLRTAVTGRTRFVPIVVVPDAGIPGDIAVENAVYTRAFVLVRKYNQNPNATKVHVPAILTWRDLLRLDGLAERGIDIFVLLKRWRNVDPQGRYGREPLPVPLSEFLDRQHLNSPMSQREHRRGWDLFEHLRSRTEQRAIAAIPPPLRQSVAAELARLRRDQPNFDNRHEFVERDGRAVRVAEDPTNLVDEEGR
ncbi:MULTISPECIES: hypothetical protein [unclassified Gordonia (in: high G+C Gram-positive bacteria)]|uniref:hypothetical protein n=1 Tax=Gordonia TaxID=2053 RepID=UPI0011119129|nr:MULTISPECIES: hypothetical protein [unclassified Gordonia (in: high G+C Gram-positive bacteria)]MCX2753893.1 hypothetical protein [Gordonia sp. 4N]MDT0220870.1 hypothetical protein [Gordonia sp. AC31]